MPLFPSRKLDRDLKPALAALSLLILTLGAGRSLAEGEAPAVRVLVAQTLALCNGDREAHAAALSDLAAAQCYLGDFDAAKTTIPKYDANDIFNQSAHHTCAQIEILITGSTESIPAVLWKDDFGFMHGDAALAFLERGDVDRALHHIEEIPKTIQSSLIMYGPRFVIALRSPKDMEARRKVLRIWASCYERTTSVFDYRASHRVPQLVAWLVAFDERKAARELCDHWHSILLAEKDIDDCGEFIGRAWAEYGLALAKLEDRAAATAALRQALVWLDKARSIKIDPEDPLTYMGYATAYAVLASYQANVVGREEALTAFNLSRDLARFCVTPKYGEHVYARIVDEQLAAGDEAGAVDTIPCLLDLVTIAECWEAVCKHRLAQNDTEKAGAAARILIEIFEQNKFQPRVARDTARIAKTVAIAGEKENARKLFRHAISLSLANDPPKLNHSLIALFQASAGFFDDAYQSLMEADEPSDRVSPLAKLCRAMAEAEYRKRDRPKRD